MFIYKKAYDMKSGPEVTGNKYIVYMYIRISFRYESCTLLDMSQ